MEASNSATKVRVRFSVSAVWSMTVMVLVLSRFGEEVPDAVCALAPDVPVGIEQAGGPLQRLRIAVHDLLPSVPLLAHERRPLEHRDVLLHRREAHLVIPGQGAHGLPGPHHLADDVAPGRIRQGLEDAVDLGVAHLIYNHLVVGYAGRERNTSPLGDSFPPLDGTPARA